MSGTKAAPKGKSVMKSKSIAIVTLLTVIPSASLRSDVHNDGLAEDSERRSSASVGKAATIAGSGFVASRESDWAAWRNTIAQVSPTPRLHIEGAVTVADNSYHVELERFQKTPMALHFRVLVQKSRAVVGQTQVERQVRFDSEMPGDQNTVVIHLPDGQQFNLTVRSTQ